MLMFVISTEQNEDKEVSSRLATYCQFSAAEGICNESEASGRCICAAWHFGASFRNIVSSVQPSAHLLSPKDLEYSSSLERFFEFPVQEAPLLRQSPPSLSPRTAPGRDPS
jgi:hypothetical protein